jgi:hypothetical protein
MEPRTLADCRALLGSEAELMSDAEVLALRDAASAFAAGVLAAYRSERRSRASAAHALGDRQDLREVPNTKGAER